jgi:hypothetical protein
VISLSAIDVAHIEIRRAEEQALRVEKMLETLQYDVGLERRGLRIIYIVDFSEIFRYLHPTLDSNRYVDKMVFYKEQLSARLLFDWLPAERVLIREYHEEMIAHFDQVAKEARSWPSCKPKSVLEIQERLKKEIELTNGEVQLLLRETQKRFIDLVSKDALNEHLVNGVQLLLGLIEGKKLAPLGGIKGIEPNYAIDEKDDEYRQELNLICKCRDHAKLYENNKVDTRAILAAKKLAESNLKNNCVFVLVSGSKFLFPAFLAVRSEPIDRTLEVPFVFIRDLNYVLLRFYYSFMEPEKMLEDTQQVRLLLKRFLSTVSRFRMISRSAITEKDLGSVAESLTRVKDQFLYFTCFPFLLSKRLLGGVIEAVHKESLESVLKEVEEAFADPEKLQKRIDAIIGACEVAVKSVEDSVRKYGGIP